MSVPIPEPTSVRDAISMFLKARLEEKLKPVKDLAKREALIEEHRPENWIPNAAKKAAALSLVTHSPKFIHPSSSASAIRFLPSVALPEGLVGTEIQGMVDDVVGNAAYLGSFAFLKVRYQGQSILSNLLRDDPETIAALAVDPSLAANLAKQFKQIAISDKPLSTDELAKQIYFPVPETKDDYHLLTIQYPTSLAHGFYETIREDKFSKKTKELRNTPVAEISAPASYREYRDLAKIGFGGSKPQNITQLNSERGGNAYLLSSIPPLWSKNLLRLSPTATTIFDRNLQSNVVIKSELRSLLEYLRQHHAKNEKYREAIEAQILVIADAVLDLVDLMSELPPGWTDAYSLIPEEKDWLDPFRSEQENAASSDPVVLGNRFGSWLLAALGEFNSPRRNEGRSLPALALDSTHAAAWSAIFAARLQFSMPQH
ncbi:type I-F CRISPR-associated protein Csy1 [Luteolibacter algae]|uniref:Type I-F CRISPR-associated protein Csy1 n=1 Tax=Luteolibacter algae TaxID=454151 RepID=A0ABW5DAW7_9BACT